jgi:hypothetical protein
MKAADAENTAHSTMIENTKRFAPTRKHDVGRQLKERVTQEQETCPETEHGGCKAQILVHRERGESGVHPVEEIGEKYDHDQRDQPPCALGEDAVVSHFDPRATLPRSRQGGRGGSSGYGMQKFPV